MAQQAVPSAYQFGHFEVEPRERRLLVSGEPAPLSPRAFDVLVALIERAGKLVTKDELLELVWPGLVVEDNNLQQQISLLRKVLGAEAIATVAGRGYRFTAEARRVAAQQAQVRHQHLPQQLTSFVGRERDVEEAGRLLTGTRLLTLVGMGGVGKTRLALQVAAYTLADYPDGAWFLDLAPIREPSLVASEAAQMLGIQEEPGRSVIQTLCTRLHDRNLIIILDNCEHLTDACANVATALLRGAPGVRLIATSREALNIPGEQLCPVLPMAVPDRAAGTEALAKCDAVQLFVDRVRLHKPNFQPTSPEVWPLADLCARLEGIPLALELAAARMRSLSVAEINARLRDRFRLLSCGGRVVLERQKTLRSLVDWSYDLLDSRERVLFDRLSVFSGGFDLAAAEDVCSSDPLASVDIVDLLGSLVDKSLVMADERGDRTRYRTLETIREYAREKLNMRAEATATAVRHCEYFLSIAKAASRGLQGPEQREWAERAETELDNMRAAINFALEGGVDPILAVKFSVALLNFWLLRGYVNEGRKYMSTALAVPAVRASDVAHAHALFVMAALATNQGQHAEAARLLEECLALRRRLANRVDIAASLSTLALVRLQEGDAEGARRCEEEALAIFRQLGERLGEAVGLVHLGHIEMYLEHDQEARNRFEAAAEIGSAIQHREIESECERMLGELALEQGHILEATARFAASLEMCRQAGDKRDEAISLWSIGKADLLTGDIALAQSKLDEALRAFRNFDMRAEMIGCLEDFAKLSQSLGCFELAVRLNASACGSRQRFALARRPRAERRWERALDAARRKLTAAQFHATWEEGSAWSLDDAIEQALGLRAKVVA